MPDDFAAAYRGLLQLAGARACRVEDTHGGRWWPSYALRALRHRELGRCPAPRCDDCRRAVADRFLPAR